MDKASKSSVQAILPHELTTRFEVQAALASCCGISVMADANVNVRISPTFNDKLTVLCKLRGSIYFEKILTASSAYLDNLHGPSTLALPAWFVHEHGDKFRKYVMLRTELSTTPWSVTLTVFHKSPTVRQVKFAGGWKTFATFHSLVVGDSVIFALTAISEFEVYMFPGNRKPGKLPYQIMLKKRSDDSGLPLKKPKPYIKIEPVSALNTVKLNEPTIGDQQRAQVSPAFLRISDKSRIVTDPTPHDEELIKAPGASDDPGSEPGYIFQGPTIRKKLNELLAQKKAMFESAYGNNNPKPLQNEDTVHLPDPLSKPNAMDSSSRDHHDSNNGHDEPMPVQSGISEGDVPPQIETRGLTLPKMPVNFPLSAGFLKQLTASNFCCREAGARTACMEIPVVFWRTYGSRLRSVVKLQGIHEESLVRTAACLPILQADETWRLYLRAGWRDFADANGLEVGQVLEFTLTADSFFVIRSAIS